MNKQNQLEDIQYKLNRVINLAQIERDIHDDWGPLVYQNQRIEDTKLWLSYEVTRVYEQLSTLDGLISETVKEISTELDKMIDSEVKANH